MKDCIRTWLGLILWLHIPVNTMYDSHTYLSEVIPTSKVVRVDKWIIIFTSPVLSLAYDKKIMCETKNAYTYSKLCVKLQYSCSKFCMVHIQ